MRVLVVNAGSSSVKLRVVGDGSTLEGACDLERHGDDGLGAALDAFLDAAPPVEAAGHRVVHGGADYRAPLLVDADADAHLVALADLAPLHNPPGLAAIHALRAHRPGLPQVACFDTTFHDTIPDDASTFALPARWRVAWGIRRYGFHGMSHAWASRRAAALLGRPLEGLRLVTAHLGAGASLAAVAEGRSVDTTMGFTPLDGLVMATRPGALDPGAVLWAMRHGGLSADEVERELEHGAGLAGLAPSSGGDLRRILASADGGDADARLAYGVYLHRLRGAVAQMVAAMGGIDGLVFTGGAGEGSARLRSDACAGLGFLGVPSVPAGPGPAAGGAGAGPPEGGAGDRVLSAAGAAVAVLVVAAREDLEIDRQVREVLGAAACAIGGRPVGPVEAAASGNNWGPPGVGTSEPPGSSERRVGT